MAKPPGSMSAFRHGLVGPPAGRGRRAPLLRPVLEKNQGTVLDPAVLLHGVERAAISAEVVRASPGGTPSGRVDLWADANGPQIERVAQMLAEAETRGRPSLPVLSVAAREVRDLVTRGAHPSKRP